VRRELDLIVIGGGAAGISAAREGARRGARTALVQDGPVGGDCTFTGCVPSKALLAAAARGESFADAMAAVRGGGGPHRDDSALAAAVADSPSRMNTAENPATNGPVSRAIPARWPRPSWISPTSSPVTIDR
jgi:pyruvate/2-oxoglutarate dehydrogenase complex dihydrolipoamide dehydrogenase (E3) component